jgi:hypothetical protein
MGYCIVIWGIFRDIFGLLTENQFQEYGIFAFFVLGIWDIDTPLPPPLSKAHKYPKSQKDNKG